MKSTSKDERKRSCHAETNAVRYLAELYCMYSDHVVLNGSYLPRSTNMTANKRWRMTRLRDAISLNVSKAIASISAKYRRYVCRIHCDPPIRSKRFKLIDTTKSRTWSGSKAWIPGIDALIKHEETTTENAVQKFTWKWTTVRHQVKFAVLSA